MPKIFYQNFKSNLFNKEGDSILETSLLHDIPHAHACGGNAVCSSCRVCIEEGLENVHPRNEKEQRLADKLGFTDDIRLGCQTKLITGDIIIKLPVLDEIDVHIVSDRDRGEGLHSVGEQKELSFLFADMEGFTSFTESSPPYDVVHILNRYYYIVGKLVKAHRGLIVDYFGDGFLAVFGVEQADRHASDAVKTGVAINAEMGKFNQYVQSLLNKEFKVRIGIHSDRVILGTIGMEGMKKLSVIGDGVNFASRIESANKDLGTYFLISESTYEKACHDIQVSNHYNISVKGKTGTYNVFEVSGMKDSGMQTVIETEKAIMAYITDNLSVELIPGFLRVVYHDAGDFNVETGTGGLNASILHPEELELEENSFITGEMVEFLNVVKMKFPIVSYADLIAVTGAVGINKLGGPEIVVGLGRVDDISKGGDPELAKRDDSLKKLKRNFSKLGMSSKELVVLSGAHTIGKADGKPFTSDFYNFSNSYFKILVNKDDPHHDSLLPSDRVLMKDPKLLSLVQQYAADEELFFKDFREAYKRLTWLGQSKEPLEEI